MLLHLAFLQPEAQPTDRSVVFLINEGNKQRVWWTQFEGNTISSDGRLRTQIQSKPGILWMFGGYVDPKKITEDEDRLKAYYRSLGFFSAEISRELSYNEGETWLTLNFVIHEGPRYQVRNVSFIGNTKFSTQQLETGLTLKGNEFFDQAKMNKDLGLLKDTYGGQGYILADVQANPRFSEDTPGTLDLVYEIKEGERWRVGRINVHINGGDTNPHTKEATIVNRISLRPGDIVDTRQLRDSVRRLQFSQLFLVDRAGGQIPKIVFTPPDKDQDKDEDKIAEKPKGTYRGQSPDGGVNLPPGTPHMELRDGGLDAHGDRLINIIYEGDDWAIDSAGRAR
jgi:outer membrane protein insertion porin family